MSSSFIFKLNSFFKYNNLASLNKVRSYYNLYNTEKLDYSSKIKLSILKKQLDESRTQKPHGEVKYENVTSSICLQTVEVPADQKSNIVKAKNCVLLFPHHDSSDEYIQKITSFYHQNLLDVIVVRPTKSHFFLPETGKTVVADLVAKLSGNNLPLIVDNFLVHTTSSGAFFYTLLCDQLSKSVDLFKMGRIKAQIFDGIVLGNYKQALKTYRSSLPNALVIGGDKYEQASEAFIQQPHAVDTLVYHSIDDELCTGAEELLERWMGEGGMDVSVSCWSRSVHAQNCLRHPDKYLKALETFLIKTGFIQNKE